MAQPSSAQREPSMEEILASIRRIIEDGDGGKPAEQAPDAGGADDAAATSELDEGAEIGLFRSELDDGPVTASATNENAPKAFEPAPEKLKPASSNVELLAPRERTAPRFEPRPEPVAQSHSSDWRKEPAAPVREPVSPQAPAFSAPASPAAPARTPEPEATTDQNAIISEKAGRQVAAAFGELSEVFAASRRRDIDEMAEDMLRPMLREWMDNNLPVLVERLVREEIERVARGGER